MPEKPDSGAERAPASSALAGLDDQALGQLLHLLQDPAYLLELGADDRPERILEANAAACRLTGYEPATLRGMDLFDLVSRDLGEEQLHRVLAGLQSKGHLLFESMHRGADGRQIPVECHACFVPLAGRRLVLSVCRDISQRNAVLGALATAEVRNRVLLESVSEGIISVDRTGGVTYVNPAAEQILGYSAAELHGRDIHATVHHSYPDGSPYPQESCPMHRAGLTGNTTRCAAEMLWAKDGTPIPVEYTASPILHNGENLGSVVVFRDIRKRLEAEAACRASEERYRALFEQAALGMFLVDTRVHIVAANPQAATMLGYTPEELQDVTPEELIHPEDLAARHPRDNMARLSEGDSIRIERRYRRKDGSYIPVEVFLRKMTGADKALVMFHDISERKAAQAALQESERKYRSIFAAVNDGIIIHDGTTGAILDANQHAVQLTGFSLEEMRLLGVKALCGGPLPYTPELALANIRRVGAGGAPLTLEWLGRSKDGHVRWAEVSLSREQGSGANPRVIAVVRDIDERVKAREALQRANEMLEDKVRRRTAALERAKAEAELANLAKGQFLSAISHEMRTPLNGILGFAQIIEDTPLDAEQREHLAEVVGSARALDGLIRNLLDFVALERRPEGEEAEIFVIRQLLESVLRELEERATAKGLRLELQLDEDVPELLQGHRDLLFNALRHLMDNAVKFTEQGGVELQVSCLRGCTPEGAAPVLLSIAVRDTGIGIREEDQERLFSPLSQLEGSYNRRYGGVGIGLAYVRRMTELLGGSIRVASTPGQGTVFTLQLPFQPGP